MKILVPISGGKDSQACLKLAVAEYGSAAVEGLFCDTQFEHPKTYAHVEHLERKYGIVMHRVTGGSVFEKVVKYGRFPGGGARHCTDELKMRVTRDFLRMRAVQLGHGFSVWYGMRAGESSAREKRYSRIIDMDEYAPHEVFPKKYPKYLAKMGVSFRLPILDWIDSEVFDFLEGDHNPLYDDGFDRVGCFPCLAAGDATKERAFSYDEFGRQQFEQVIDMTLLIGKSVWTSKGGKGRNDGLVIDKIRAAVDALDGGGCSLCNY